MLHKDFNEISIIKENFQNIKILLCTFHVLKYFKKKVSELEITRGNKQTLMCLISKLVYSKTHSCQEMWVHYFRISTGYLGTNTNNRLESHNQKLKQYIKRNCHLSKSIQGLLRFIKDTFKSISIKQFQHLKTKINHSKENPINTLMINSCVQPAYELIKSQQEK